jgi:hypothetical protein
VLSPDLRRIASTSWTHPGGLLLMVPIRRLSGLALISVLLSCCVSANIKAQERANLEDPHFISAWNDCVRETRAFGLIPDYGITWEQHFYNCMAKANWTQTPRWNPRSVGHYHRIGEEPFNQASPTEPTSTPSGPSTPYPDWYQPSTPTRSSTPSSSEPTYKTEDACPWGQYWNSARGQCEKIGS